MVEPGQWSLDGWMEQDVWIPVRPPVCRRRCCRPATGEIGLCSAHLSEYFATVLYATRPRAVAAGTRRVLAGSNF